LYLQQLGSLKQQVPSLELPFVPAWADPVWHLFVIRHPRRNQLQKLLTESGIGTMIHYPIAVHKSEAYRDFQACSLPLATDFADQVLSLPIGPQLDSAQMETVCRILSNYLIDLENSQL
jgi:dTDP-3-amino-3,4,6-trideoxy-alpha-D-glucose transaminase